MFEAAGKLARARLGVAGVLLALLAVACSNRVPAQQRAALRARAGDLPIATAEVLPELPGPIEGVVAALAPAPAEAPAPAHPASIRSPRPQPTVLPDDGATP